MAETGDILICLDAEEAVIEDLGRIFPKRKVRLGPWVREPGEILPAGLLKGVEVFLCELPPANFDDFDFLKWVQLTSAGYSQVLDLPILERGIRVTNGRGNFDVPIAEWNIMAMQTCHRTMLDMLQNQRNRAWDRDARFQSELRGSIVGFYGYGGIARETARLCKAMGLTVWALTRDGKVKTRPTTYGVPGTGDPDGAIPDRVFSPERKRSFLSEVDFLVLTMPHTPATDGIVGEAELRALKNTAVLINPARARLVREEALIKCLTEGWIRAAADANPHFLERLYDIFLGNCRRYAESTPLLNELTEEQLKGA